MEDFKQYKRTQIAELRPVTFQDIKAFNHDMFVHAMKQVEFKISISDDDLNAGSPKFGDMIARNPNNHNDQWLVSAQYFKDNFSQL
jgi:hypothetical protein